MDGSSFSGVFTRLLTGHATKSSAVLSAGRARELIGRRDEAAPGCTSALPLATAASTK